MKRFVAKISIILMLFIGLLLMFNGQIQNLLVQKMSEQLVNESIEVNKIANMHDNVFESDKSVGVVSDPASSVENEVLYDFDVVQSLSIWDVLHAQFNVNNLEVEGIIHIPTINLALPIIKGVGKSSLAVGAGTLKAEQKMGEGNYTLASHYIEGKEILFGPLYRLNLNEMIYITDRAYLYEYEVTKIEIIEATDVFVIDDISNETLLTLITCAESGTKRLMVQASFIGKKEMKDGFEF